MTTYQDFKRSRVFELRPNAYAYGFGVGILQMETNTLAIPGDISNATSFDYPVLYGPVSGASAEELAAGGTELQTRIVEMAVTLESQGVRAIAAESGLFAAFHNAITAAVKVPVLNPLSLLPLLAREFLGEKKRLCMLTAYPSLLTLDFLEAAGLNVEPNLEIVGLENLDTFGAQVLGGEDEIDAAAVGADVSGEALRALKNMPDVGAFLLESPMLPPYAFAVQEATSLPVYDLKCLIDNLREATHRVEYEGDY